MTTIGSRTTTASSRLLVLALIVAGLTIFGALPGALKLDEPAVTLWYTTAWTVVPLLAGLACWRAAKRSTGSDRRAWRSFGLGCLLWIVGTLTWGGHGWFGMALTFPSLADIFFSLTSVTFMLGIYHYSLEGSKGSRLQGTNFALAVTAVIAIGFIVYFPALVQSNLSRLGAIVAFSYPVTWLGTSFFCLICYCLYVQGRRTFPFILILAAAATTAAADLFYGLDLLDGRHASGEFYYIFWLASFAFLAWAALAHGAASDTAEKAAGRDLPETRAGEALIPGLSVAAIVLAALAAQWHHLGGSIVLFVPPVIAFATFLAVREHTLLGVERKLRTEADRSISRIAESEEQLSRVLEHTTDGVIVLDWEFRITYANRNAIEQHFSGRAYLGLPMWQVLGSSPDNEFYANYRTAVEQQTPVRFEAYSVQSDLWFEDHVFPTPDGLTIFFRDVTERRRLREELVRMAQHDPLTGLANRTLFDERLDQGLRSGRRHGDLVLVLIDLDGFKQVNDSMGHQAGDALLQKFASRLTGLVRQGDTVARFGGDEFAIIQPGPTEPEGGAEVARRIFEALRTPFEIHDTEVVLSASIGIAMAPDHGIVPNDLIRNADLALYRAKETTGRSNYVMFKPGMDNRRAVPAAAAGDAVHGRERLASAPLRPD